MLTIQGYKIASYGCELVNPKIIKDRLDELGILKITLDGTLLYSDKEILMCDSIQPMSYVNNVFLKNTLCIQKTYAENNIQEVYDMIKFICENTKHSSITIEDTLLINEEILDVIANNSNIKKVSLGCSEDVFVLTEEVYNKFKGTNIEVVNTKGVVDSLKENFDKLIGYNANRNLIGFDNYERLTTNDSIYLKTELDEDEIFYLKYLNKNAEVYFNYDYFSNVFRCIDRLREVGHTGKITISIEKKNDLNNYIFSHINSITSFDNIEINLSGAIYSFADYIKYEKKLIDLVLPAMDYSPFEKFLYAYNVTKNFKEYKENEEDKTSSRDLYQIMDNDYMVCVGYSKLLGDLLDKLGIDNYNYSVSVDVGLDSISQEASVLPDFVYDEKTKELKEVQTQEAGHARRMVHIVDPKYGIDGYYFTDPTWDNNMKHDTYNYALMTQEEYIGMDRYNYYSIYGVSELFFVKTLEEFYLKLNIYLDKNKNETEVGAIYNLLYVLENLDSEFYNQLLSKYPQLERFKVDLSKDEVLDILLMMGERIVTKANNVVDGKCFREGITSLYGKSISDEEELVKKIDDIMEYNKKRQAICFPTRYKIDNEENKMVIHNLYNKFDLEEEPKLNI